ncbi:DUF3159 domain-containing protein [Actinomadura gamaensis]|uniref:DUF3159 domain-containing protein n=1 Tax=Actinomadura gamaensis TaxID=1763541 RepID=A0ABV9UAD5_9ACTN
MAGGEGVADGAGKGAGKAAAGAVAFETVEEVIRAQLTKVFGGRRGVLEGAVPTIAFTAGWIVTHDLKPSLYVGVGSALVLLAARLVQRSTPQFVLNSLVGIAIAAFFALRSGKAQDAFLPGMLYSGGVSLVMLLSIVTRWPFVGFMIGAANPDDPLAWRKEPAMVRVCTRLSWLLMLPAVLKLAVQIPLYLSGQVVALGVAKIVLGWPAYVAALGLALLMLMRTSTPLQNAGAPRSDAPAVAPEPSES